MISLSQTLVAVLVFHVATPQPSQPDWWNDQPVEADFSDWGVEPDDSRVEDTFGETVARRDIDDYDNGDETERIVRSYLHSVPCQDGTERDDDDVCRPVVVTASPQVFPEILLLENVFGNRRRTSRRKN